jgi:hypothetical protein
MLAQESRDGGRHAAGADREHEITPPDDGRRGPIAPRDVVHHIDEHPAGP